MATIRKLISKRTDKVHYNVQIRVKGYPSESATFDRLTDAKAWAAEIEGAMRRGRYFTAGEAKRVTLGQTIGRYITEMLPGKKDQAMTRQRLEYWKAELGSLPLSEVTPLAINKVRDKLMKTPIEARRNRGHNRSGATVNRYLMALAAVYRACVKDWHLLPESPTKSVSKRPETAGRVRYLTNDEEVRLLDACKASKSQDLYDVVLLSLRTGGRQSEVLGLSWTDVNLQEKWVRFRITKNGETRIVPLVDDATVVLKRRSGAQNGASGL
jgi:integrase